jgi:hypothetical protein
MRSLLGLVVLVLLGACQPAQSAPVVPDAPADGACGTYAAITASRLVRNPDGTPLVILCDAGAQ